MIKSFTLDVMGEPGSGGALGYLKDCDGVNLVEDATYWFNTTFTDSAGRRKLIQGTVTNITERTVAGSNPIYDTESPPVARNGNTYTIAYDSDDLPAGVTEMSRCNIWASKVIACPDENTCCPVFSSDDFEGAGTEEDPITIKEGRVEDGVEAAILAALAPCNFQSAESLVVSAPGPNTYLRSIYYRNGIGDEELAYNDNVGLHWSTDSALEAAINNSANEVPQAGSWNAEDGRLLITSPLEYTRMILCDISSGVVASVAFACTGPEGINAALKRAVRALGWDPAFTFVSVDSGSGGSGGGGGGSGGVISTLTYSSVGQTAVAIPTGATKVRMEIIGAGGYSAVGASVIAEFDIGADQAIESGDSLLVSVGQAVNHSNPSPNYATGVFLGTYDRDEALAIAGGGGAFGRINTGPAIGQAYNGDSTGGGSGGTSNTMVGEPGSLNNSTGTYIGNGGYGYEGGTAHNTGGKGGTSFIHVSGIVRTFLRNDGRYAGGNPATTGFTDFTGNEGKANEEGYVKLIFSN